MADRVRRLPLVAGLGKPGADEPVELGKRRAGPAVIERAAVDLEQLLLELDVLGAQLARAEVLRVVGPVAVRADPDLEERRLVLLDGEVAGRRERLDPRARPDERERKRELDLPVPAGALSVHEALPDRGRLGLLHSGPEVRARVLHRSGGDLVGEPHPLLLLLRLDLARAREKRRCVGGRLAEAGEPRGGVGRRLADHAVAGLGAQAELEADPAVAARDLLRELQGARGRGPRVVGGVALDQADVCGPGGSGRVLLGGLEAEERRLALAREDDGVVALHAPEVRQVEDVVGRADDQRVELLLRHQPAHAFELGVVAGPAHEIVTLPARPRHRQVRDPALSSTSREAGQRAPPWVGG